jgi:hypothetical protein|tara:strand:+ start:477 stop:842 length:366 start_codon:yes stop_codon:yes gene_type:complete
MLNQKNFKDLVGEFQTFHQKNPEVYKLFVRFTFQAINRGHHKLSSEMIINRIRWETNVMTTDKEYKINNDYKPFYSRMFMTQYSKYNNFFQKRGSYADKVDWSSYVVQSDHQTSEVTQTIS